MINAAFVRGCKPRAKMYEVTCDALPGFILRVLPTGKKVALVRYRVEGKDRRERIGLLGPSLSIDEARRRAALMLAGIAAGTRVDETPSPPAGGTHAPPEQPQPPPSKTTTLRELAERFVRIYVDVHLKAGTAERYRHQLRTIILPGLADPEKNVPPLGDRDYRTVKRTHIAELHASMKDRPGAANNMVMVCASLFTRIINDWELAPDMRNPAHGVKLYPMRQRERFLTPEERQRLRAYVQAGLKAPRNRRGHLKIQSVWAIELLALTGRRKSEILGLKWPMVDWQHSILNLPDTKTGQLKALVSDKVIALLRHIHEHSGKPSTGYVLRSDKGTRLSGIDNTWRNIRAATELSDVRIHDLRHSFASDALMSGVPLAVVGELLGHKQARSTQRYAHLANYVVREGLERATTRIVQATEVPAPVASFTRMTDGDWKKIAATVERTRGACGGTRSDLRRIVDGVRWVLHHGARWRELPAEFGKSTTAWRWYDRWCGNGTWKAIAEALNLPPTEAGREPGHRPPGAVPGRGSEVVRAPAPGHLCGLPDGSPT